MHLRLIAAIFVATLLNVTATPYFRPWLESRQSPTTDKTPDCLYPEGINPSTCPSTGNMWNNLQYLDKPILQRSLSSKYRISQFPARSLHIPRQTTNTSCQQIAELQFNDWEKSSKANTPTITIPGGYHYTFSISANVVIDMVRTWTSPINSDHYTRMDPDARLNNRSGIVNFTIDHQTNIHWFIDFQYGHPNGKMLLFAEGGPGQTVPPASKIKM